MPTVDPALSEAETQIWVSAQFGAVSVRVLRRRPDPREAGGESALRRPLELSCAPPPGRACQDQGFHVHGVTLVEEAVSDRVELARRGADIVVHEDAPSGCP